MIFTLLKPVDVYLQEKLFFWVPNLDNGLDGTYARTNLIITYVIMLVFGVFVGPTIVPPIVIHSRPSWSRNGVTSAGNQSAVLNP